MTEEEFATKYGNWVLIVADVESDGPSVRANSMFALGGVAIEVATKTVLGGFSYCTKERTGATRNEDTMKFWMAPEQKPMYDALHAQQVDMADAMTGVAVWVARIKELRPDATITFASDCLPYDMKWMDTEMTEHVRPYVFGYSGFDLYSYLAGVLNAPRHKMWVVVDTLKEEGILCCAADGVVHDHHPYNDALYEAVLAVDSVRMASAVPWRPLAMSRQGVPPSNATWITCGPP